ncbi:MAG: hypothetical protein AVDCRST_MAG49-4258, partial [uncultured Thermomicrobiales bacterium]
GEDPDRRRRVRAPRGARRRARERGPRGGGGPQRAGGGRAGDSRATRPDPDGHDDARAGRTGRGQGPARDAGAGRDPRGADERDRQRRPDGPRLRGLPPQAVRPRAALPRGRGRPRRPV